MSEPSKLLQVDDLKVSFKLQKGKLDAVKGVSFSIAEGEVVAIVGESGSGKSVIAQSILRILPKNASIDNGSILFCDPKAGHKPVDLTSFESTDDYLYEVRGGRISMVFQEPMTALSPLHTIGNQVEEALVLHHEKSSSDARSETEEILRLVGFPDPARGYSMYPFELSGGLRQRAVIAMALICNPALVIADEPTTALDVTVQAQILGLMKELQKKFNTAILMITHDLGVVANMADKVVVIYHGEVMEAGTVDDIFRRPQHPYLKALIAAIPHFDMKDNERLVSLRDTDASGLTKTIHKLSSKFRAASPENMDGPHLKVENLRKEFVSTKGSWFGAGDENRIVAVDNVSFEINRGECLGLVGESGSGKTTVSKLIMKALEATSGSVHLNTGQGMKDVLSLEGRELMDFRRRVQMIFQDPYSSLNPRMTIQNILNEPYVIHGLANENSQQDDILDLIRLVGMESNCLNRYPHSFSGGQRQRIGIARALALHPEIMICDEPVSALDVSVQAQILNLLNDLRKELGLTSLFISHNLAVVNYVADRIAVMCQGRLVEIASREQLFSNPHHPYTKSLLSAVPYPDLDRLLDFETIKYTSSVEADDWGMLFKPSAEAGLESIRVDEGHFVLANCNCNPSDLRAL
jgi:peptide/nickel transport system ATP-binding protein